MYGKLPAYNTYATMPTTNSLFMGFSGYQNVNKEIIRRKLILRKPRKFGFFLMPKIQKIYNFDHIDTLETETHKKPIKILNSAQLNRNFFMGKYTKIKNWRAPATN